MKYLFYIIFLCAEIAFIASIVTLYELNLSSWLATSIVIALVVCMIICLGARRAKDNSKPTTNTK